MPPAADQCPPEVLELLAGAAGLPSWAAWRLRRHPVVSRFLAIAGDLDDVKSFARLGLWDAARRYRAGRGKTFASFAFMCMRSAVVRGCSRRGRSVPAVPRPAGGGGDGPVLPEPADPGPRPGAAMETSDEAQHLLRRLPADERRAVELTFGLGGGPPLTCRMAAAELGLTPRRVAELRRRGLARLRRAAGAG